MFLPKGEYGVWLTLFSSVLAFSSSGAGNPSDWEGVIFSSLEGLAEDCSYCLGLLGNGIVGKWYSLSP